MTPMEVRNERGKYVKGREKKKVMAGRAIDDLKLWAEENKFKAAS